MGCSCIEGDCFKNFCDGYDCCIAECMNVKNESLWFNGYTLQDCNGSCITYRYENSEYYPYEIITKNFCLTGGIVHEDDYYNIYISIIFLAICILIITCINIHRKNNIPYLVNARLINNNTDVSIARPIESTDSDAEEALSVTVVQANPCNDDNNDDNNNGNNDNNDNNDNESNNENSDEDSSHVE